MGQTSYSQSQKAGHPGLIFDTGYNDYISKLSDGVVPFGRFVSRGSDINICQLPQASTDVTDITKGWGVAVSSQTLEHSVVGVNPSGFSQYPDDASVSVMRRGRVWVDTEGSWAAGDPVYVRFATNASQTGLGAFRNAADASNAVQLAGATWINTGNAANGDIGIIEFDLV
jgi:hypothetical protein